VPFFMTMVVEVEDSPSPPFDKLTAGKPSPVKAERETETAWAEALGLPGFVQAVFTKWFWLPPAS